MNDFGLDLAIIGNGRTAALVDPLSRIVWSCYPRFDGDPIFSRLVAGGEEKGFCDVVLEGMWEYRGRSRVHTHSAAMCWAGCNRLGAIAAHLGMDERAAHWSNTAHRMQTRLIERAWNEK